MKGGLLALLMLHERSPEADVIRGAVACSKSGDKEILTEGMGDFAGNDGHDSLCYVFFVVQRI